MKIKTKLFCIVFLVVLISTSFVIYTCSILKKDFDKSHISTENADNAKFKAIELEKALNKSIIILKMMSNDTLLQKLLSKNINISKKYNSFIQNQLKKNKFKSEIVILDKTGKVFFSSKNNTKNDKISELFVKGKTELFISDIYISSISNKQEISVANPVYLEKEFEGMIIANIEIEENINTETLPEISTGKRRESFLLKGIMYLLMIIFISLIFSWVIWNLLYQTISKQIYMLKMGVLELEKGNYDIRVSLNTKNKIGELSEAFNKMAVKLQQSDKELKQNSIILQEKVRKRTIELEKQIEKIEYQRFATLNMASDLNRANSNLKLEIAEKQKAENDAKNSERKYRLLFEFSPIGISLYNLTGNLIYANEKFTKILGSPSMEATKRINILTFPAISKSRFKSDFEKCINEKKIVENEQKYTTKWAKDVNLHYILVPINNEKGEINQIQLLIEDVTERTKATELLKKSLSEKEILLKEIHHRVKNNLQVIIYLIEIQTEFITDKKVKIKLQELQERANVMSLVHEQLYSSKDLAHIDFQNYLESLLRNLFQVFGNNQNIETIIEAQNVTLGIDIAIPCGLIINELVTNILKYAFSDFANNENTNKIHIKFSKEEDNYFLSVSDNGIGISDEIDWETSNSLGLRLVRIWATHQLGGKIEMPNKSKGTTFIIIFSV